MTPEIRRNTTRLPLLATAQAALARSGREEGKRRAPHLAISHLPCRGTSSS